MLQQTQVKTVIPYWNRWMRELPDVAALASAPEQRLLKLWEGLGYYTRVRNLQKAAQHIVTAHKGQFPRESAAALDLPGVGRYTAGAVASIAFNQPAPILDGNVIRVLTRLFAISEDPREKAVREELWQLASRLVEAAASCKNPPSRTTPLVLSGSCSALNQSLMELGATLCTPQRPQCPQCPVRACCTAHRTGRAHELPNLAPRAATTRREFHAFVIEHSGRYLAAARPAGMVNAGLWEFPSIEVTGDASPPPSASLRRLISIVPARDCEPLGEVRHSITRYRITQRVFRVALPRRPDISSPWKWFLPAELARLPFTSAHKRILARCM